MSNDSITTDDSAQIRAVIAHTPSAHLLHLLHALQQQFHHVPHQAVLDVAAHLALPVSQVQAVVEFYAFFSTTPRGHYDLLFSNCTSCGYLAGGENLLQLLARRLAVTAGVTRADGMVSIGQTSCIGMCDHGPSLLLNGQPLVRLDGARIEAIAALIDAATPLAEWPPEWFRVDHDINHKYLFILNNLTCGDALRALRARGVEHTLAEITESSLRGRGGAGFSTGMKWKFCREAEGHAHYVVCNADEGEPGTFKDRVLLHSHADAVFEGMTLCAAVIGAKQGFLYLRGEYRYLLPQLQAVLALRRAQKLLGHAILGQTGFDFDIDIVLGAGAYICGEESALLESLEGKRGIPRNRPPFPVTHGYLGQPTVINNVETFAASAHIALHGSAWFRTAGTAQSAGSKILSISGDCAAPGVYEYPFGTTIRQILHDCGAADTLAVQIGGPSGTLIDSTEFGRTLSFEDLPSGGSFMVYGQGRDLLAIMANFAQFFAHESCGFCTPCRVGTTLLKNSLDKIASGHGTRTDMEEMQRMAQLVKRRSHCGLGQTAANHILDGLLRFPQLFGQRLLQCEFEACFDLDAALGVARQMTRRNDAAAYLPSPAGGRRAGDEG